MMTVSCPECLMPFSRKDAMYRHRRSKHPSTTTIQTLPPPPPPLRPSVSTSTSPQLMTSPSLPTPSPHGQEEEDSFRFLIPSNSLLVGPSRSGKSTFMFNVLRQGFIHPQPDKITWCYAVWQPLYETILRALPRVQFVKGIPYNLEDENYFDGRKQNVLILDDFLSEAKNDKRISRLFTQTSHHKNVLIFLLLQNLFPRGKESRDIALNSHYVTLFNSPVDRQQIKVFARRIFPDNVSKFMSLYETAVETPYGNLTVDLAPCTSEKNRLHLNILTRKPTSHQSVHYKLVRNIKDASPANTLQSFENIHTEQANITEDRILETAASNSEESHPLSMATACTDCGVLIDNTHDLQRHVKWWCPVKALISNKRKRCLMSEDSDEDEEQPVQTGSGINGAVTQHKLPRPWKPTRNVTAEEWQNVGLQRLWDRRYERVRHEMRDKKKQYEKLGRTDEWIDKRMKQLWDNMFIDNLNAVLEYTQYFKDAPLFVNIFQSLDETDPSSAEDVVKGKIARFLKPKLKDVLTQLDRPELESDDETEMSSSTDGSSSDSDDVDVDGERSDWD